MVTQSIEITSRAGTRPGHRVLAMTGAVSLETVPDFLKAVRAETAPAVILDFAKVPFIDSAGVGALVQCYVHYANGKRRLALASVGARVRIVLEITRVDKFFPAFATVDEAEAGLS